MKKIAHRKSRLGCGVCKARRVKCDQRHPICQPCARLNLDCRWPKWRPAYFATCASSPQLSPTSSAAASSDAGTSSDMFWANKLLEYDSNNLLADEASIVAVPNNGKVAQSATLPCQKELPISVPDTLTSTESRQRRLLEHRLMVGYMTASSRMFNVIPSPEWQQVFTERIPQIALEHENLHFAVMSISATHLLHTTDPNSPEMYRARYSYFIAAVRCQRQMVDRLSLETADALSLGAWLIFINSLVMLQIRPLEPYTPPVEWLRMGMGTASILRQCIETIVNTQEPKGDVAFAILTLANIEPNTADKANFNPILRQRFDYLLSVDLPSCGDDWSDGKTRPAYEQVLSYIGSIQAGIDNGEPTYALCRRIESFAMVVSNQFVQLLSQQRPRSLVILAHYFATLAQVKEVWWLGRSTRKLDSLARREIYAIYHTIPTPWRSLMAWPLTQTGIDTWPLS